MVLAVVWCFFDIRIVSRHDFGILLRIFVVICPYCGIETSPLAYHEGRGDCEDAINKLNCTLIDMIDTNVQDQGKEDTDEVVPCSTKLD